jgi:hypothetical protein
MHNVDLLPRFVNEDTGATLAMLSLPHNHGAELELGGTYFFLLSNTRNALRHGSMATLVMGDVRLEHIVVEG